MDLTNNAREITSINIWVNGINKQADVLTADNYFGYDFNGSVGEVFYSLQKYEIGTNADGNMFTMLIPIISGKVQLTTDVVNNWGSDDQIIFNYLAQQLNLTLV